MLDHTKDTKQMSSPLDREERGRSQLGHSQEMFECKTILSGEESCVKLCNLSSKETYTAGSEAKDF